MHTGNLWVQYSNRTHLSTDTHKLQALYIACAFNHLVKGIEQDSQIFNNITRKIKLLSRTMTFFTVKKIVLRKHEYLMFSYNRV